MTLDAGVAHLFGDYVVQSDWMALEKQQATAPAVAHAVTYAACFVPVTRSLRALAVIGGTHYLIDRHRLARYVVWAKNQAAPARHRYPLSHAGWHGYHGEHRPIWTEQDVGDVTTRLVNQSPTGACVSDGRPEWLAGWLLIIADNALHLAINGWALRRWGSR